MIRWMRLVAWVLPLFLSACAGMVPDWSSDQPPAPKPVVSKTRIAPPPSINIDKQAVEDFKAPYSDLWNRIRDGFVLDDLDSPLVIKHVRWYAERQIGRAHV